MNKKRSSLEEINNQILLFNIKKVDQLWIGFRTCMFCEKEVKHYSQNKSKLLSKIKGAIKKKSKCSNCPGFGKKRETEILENEFKKYNVFFKNDNFFGQRNCPYCNNVIIYKATKKYYLLRNIRNADNKKTLCYSCSQSGEKNSFFNKQHTIETKNNVSKSRKGKACGDKNPMSNPKYRKKVSESLRKAYDSGKLDYVRELSRNNIIKTILSGKLNNKPISKPEKEIAVFLKDNQIETCEQFRINTFRYDILIKNKNILIEYNGDYWHCNPKKYSADYFNHKKQMTAQQIWDYDKHKIGLAIKNGYSIVIVWENDYKKDKIKTLNNLLNL